MTELLADDVVFIVVSETANQNPLAPFFLCVLHFLIQPYFLLRLEQKMTSIEECIARVGANDLSLMTLELNFNNIGEAPLPWPRP